MAVLIGLVPFGFYTKFYSGPFSAWVNDSLGGVLYVVFWSLLFFLFAPNAKPSKIVSAVLIITCILELLQLWNPPLLELVRSNFIGRTIIGSLFSWLDFLHYAIGALIAFALIKFLNEVESK